jgi:hypothetical protein
VNKLNVIPLRAVVWLAGLIGLAAAHYVRAQEPVVDPPGRVARLSLMDGEVSLAPAGTEEWADGVLNRPITSGDRLWVGADGRAELQIGTASVHLDRSTGFEFIELDDDVMQMSVTEGVATVRVRTLGDRENIQVETPNGTVHFRHPGDYTVQVDPETDRTIVRTRNGEAEVTGSNKSFRVRADEEGVFTGLDGLTANIGKLPPRTAFESWANDRDRRGDTSESARYVSREVVGYEDLDSEGDWIEEPEYGHVWRPRYVVHDWAPYRYGRWGWVAPWGWTWIDDARWGFAPFHYGRWAFVRHRWCWVPGPRHIRPYYAPALVGWIGGPSVNVSVSFGSGVGWFPLGPREVYVPWYRHTPRYVRHVNVSNTIIVNNINVTNVYGRRGQRPRYAYADHTVTNAVTAVQRDVFVRGGRVGSQRVNVNDRDLRQWRDDVRPSSIAPERQSILAGQPRREAPPRAAFNQENPKRFNGGDFRATRVAAEQIKRAQANQRDLAPENRIALREPTERVQSMRGQQTRQNEVSSEHRSRPPVQALQGSPPEDRSNRSGDNSIRRSRESIERRDTFQRSDDTRREQPQIRVQPQIRAQPQIREERQLREQPSELRREVREAPVQRRVSPPVERRISPPIERRSAPQVEQRPAPRVEQRPEPRAERSQPRVERQHSDRGSTSNSNQGSSRRESSGEGPRERPNRRPD